VFVCLLRGSLCYRMLKKDLGDYPQDDLSIFCFMCFPCVYVHKGSLCYWILKKELGDYTQDDLNIFGFICFACVYVFT
jgi:hypothetical protein